MRFILSLLGFCGLLFACSGDCMSCHSNLDYVKDEYHMPMQECKICHTDEKMEKIDMGGCGQDCFACHNVQKLFTLELSSAHQVIKECIECHEKLRLFDVKKLFGPPQKLKEGIFKNLPQLP